MSNKPINQLVKRNKIPTEKMTAADRRAFELGRAEIARGEYATLEELKHELEADRRKSRKKKSQTVSRQG